MVQQAAVKPPRRNGSPGKGLARRAVSVTAATRAPLNIVIADDHTIFREGLRALLEAEPGFRVVGEASDGAEALRLVRGLDPDVLLLDMAMPRMPGKEALAELSREGNSVRTIVLTAAIEPPDVVASLQLGARGVLLKDAATALLFKCIHCVADGQYWVGRDAVGNLVEYLRQDLAVRDPAQGQGHGLTPREREIVSAIVAGSSNRDTARQCAISEQTVKHHLTRIYDKLGVSNRLELALFAIERRLVDTAH